MTGKRIWIFNLALAALFVWGVLKVQADWTAFEGSHRQSRIQPEQERAVAKAAPRLEAANSSVPDEALLEIASKNPFSFDRNDINLVEAPAPIVTAPKPVLFGTLLLGNDRLALLGKDAATRSGAPVKVGDTFEGWQVVEVQDKSVVVSANGVLESLVVGRVPIARRTERTESAAPAPVASPRAAAPAASSQSQPVRSVLSPTKPTVVVPPGSVAVPNPFGVHIEKAQ
jgi:hypothetical protein